MQLALICHTCNDDAYEITCLSHDFPESVCTGVYGVRYILSLLLFTLGSMLSAGIQLA